MADIIDFGDRRKRVDPDPTYRVYRCEEGVRIEPGRIVRASNDAEARFRAFTLLEEHVIELWDRARLVARLRPHDCPVATAIMLLDEPPPSET